METLTRAQLAALKVALTVVEIYTPDARILIARLREAMELVRAQQRFIAELGEKHD